MWGGKNIVVACTAAIASSLSAVSLLAIGKTKTLHLSEEVPVGENSVENATLCYGNLHLLKW